MRASTLVLVIYYLVQSSAFDQQNAPSAAQSMSQKLNEYFESSKFQELLNDTKLRVISEISHITGKASNDFLDKSRTSINLTVGLRITHEHKNVADQLHYKDLQNRQLNLSRDTAKEHITGSVFYPENCMEIMTSGQKVSGVYTIKPSFSAKPFPVLCDMKTHGGGWTHIQKRVDGRENFERNWSDYKFGFGNLEDEFWLGLDNIYALTGEEATELLIEITDRDGLKAYALYKNFAIGREQDSYPLTVLSGYSGDAGDSLSPHLGMKFSTYDLDNSNMNCATAYKSGWWFTQCFTANLNGKFTNIDLPATYEHMGITWRDFRAADYCHAKARMMVRPL